MTANDDARRTATRALKQLAREVLALDDDAVVMVSELQCHEPGCPPVETVIAVLGHAARHQYKCHKPLAEVTRADLEAAVRTPHAH
jgi:hypothetical protein